MAGHGGPGRAGFDDEAGCVGGLEGRGPGGDGGVSAPTEPLGSPWARRTQPPAARPASPGPLPGPVSDSPVRSGSRPGRRSIPWTRSTVVCTEAITIQRDGQWSARRGLRRAGGRISQPAAPCSSPRPQAFARRLRLSIGPERAALRGHGSAGGADGGDLVSSPTTGSPCRAHTDRTEAPPPPSITNSAPVRYLDSSAARNTITFATSSGSASRPSTDMSRPSSSSVLPAMAEP